MAIKGNSQIAFITRTYSPENKVVNKNEIVVIANANNDTINIVHGKSGNVAKDITLNSINLPVNNRFIKVAFIAGSENLQVDDTDTIIYASNTSESFTHNSQGMAESVAPVATILKGKAGLANDIEFKFYGTKIYAKEYRYYLTGNIDNFENINIETYFGNLATNLQSNQTYYVLTDSTESKMYVLLNTIITEIDTTVAPIDKSKTYSLLSDQNVFAKYTASNTFTEQVSAGSPTASQVSAVSVDSNISNVQDFINNYEIKDPFSSAIFNNGILQLTRTLGSALSLTITETFTTGMFRAFVIGGHIKILTATVNLTQDANISYSISGLDTRARYTVAPKIFFQGAVDNGAYTNGTRFTVQSTTTIGISTRMAAGLVNILVIGI